MEGQEAMNDFKAVAKRLLDSGSLSDFTITCAGKQYKVHRVLLMCHSEYFKACFEGGFKEAEEETIDLKEDPPEAVEKMIHYFYHFDYDHTVPESSGMSPGLIHSMMYAVADKYAVSGLKKLARVKFARSSSPGSYDGLVKMTQHVVESTPDTDFGLRDIVLLETAMSFRGLLWEARNGNCDLGCYVELFTNHLARFPAMASELAIFAMFLPFIIIRPECENTSNKTDEMALAKMAHYMVRYLRTSGQSSRGDNLHTALLSINVKGYE